ncbi:MAG TPA: tRNA dihydrouridine(20/20a) synthase DusA [Fibrobacteria bacterium]|nr:tRNA dihydrouridine(20/20a) synthase DusA [Fibrobacteria bacterium]
MPPIPKHISVAPMMECTDRHFRFLARLISKHTRLYTEMVTAPAIVHGKKEHLLGFSPEEHPVALQLGGSDPGELERCAALGAERGYDEINLNCGCPSDRVQSGKFGACLMAEPDLVRDCVKAMIRGAGPGVPVTVKHRIGIDDRDSYDELKRFVATVADGGCTLFAVHARKAWLKGLSPKENREKPPLNYEVVRRLKADFPELQFVLNGGIVSLDQAEPWFHELDGVMIGREAYRDPMMLAAVDARFHGATTPPPSTEEVVRAYIPYARARLAEGERLHFIARHLHGLFLGAKGAKAWRTTLAEGAGKPGAGVEVIERALEAMADAARRHAPTQD